MADGCAIFLVVVTALLAVAFLVVSAVFALGVTGVI